VADQKPKGGKKNRKWGRNVNFCRAYQARNQRERNKVKRLSHYLLRHPEDKAAVRALARWQTVLRVPVSAAA